MSSTQNLYDKRKFQAVLPAPRDSGRKRSNV